jgi:hypothetical protein
MSLQNPAAPTRPGGRDPEKSKMIIFKSHVLTILRERGQNARADFVNRELPELIDSTQHGGLLATLNLDPSELVTADPA